MKERAKRFLEGKVISTIIQSTLKPEAPVLVSKGEVIADGFDSELDELRDLLRSGKDHLNKMLERESERTQILS